MKFLHPKYWLIWMGFGLLRLVSLLPFAMQMKMGRALGRVVFKVWKKRRAIARSNIAKCLPSLSPEEQNNLLIKHFETLGLWVVEMSIGWWTPHKKLRNRVQTFGLNHIEKAISKNRPIIFLATHLTTMEISAHLLHHIHPFYLVFRDYENPVVSHLVRKFRRKSVLGYVHQRDTRALLGHLKKNHAIWMAPDQNFRRKGGIEIPFFNHPAMTNTSLPRFTKISNAMVLPFYAVRNDNDSGYQLIIEAPLKDFPSDNIVKDTTLLNQVVENIVKKQPEQYLWIHRRFKPKKTNQ